MPSSGLVSRNVLFSDPVPRSSKHNFELNVARGLNTQPGLVPFLSKNVKLGEEDADCQQCQRLV